MYIVNTLDVVNPLIGVPRKVLRAYQAFGCRPMVVKSDCPSTCAVDSLPQLGSPPLILPRVLCLVLVRDLNISLQAR